jgi:sulfite reductase alpha subunit-like flavoprotein
LLDSADSSRSIRQITFQLPEGVSYESGDHVSVSPMNGEKLVQRFIRLFETELTITRTTNPAFGDLSSDEMIELYSMTLFDLESVEDGERMSADTFFKTPTSLKHVLESYIDLAVSHKNIPELLALLKRFLDELFAKLDHVKGEFEVVSSDDLVMEISNIFTDILEATPQKVTAAMDGLVARFPTVVELLDHFKPLFLDDFIAKTLGWKESGPIVKLAEGENNSCCGHTGCFVNKVCHRHVTL